MQAGKDLFPSFCISEGPPQQRAFNSLQTALNFRVTCTSLKRIVDSEGFNQYLRSALGDRALLLESSHVFSLSNRLAVLNRWIKTSPIIQSKPIENAPVAYVNDGKIELINSFLQYKTFEKKEWNSLIVRKKFHRIFTSSNSLVEIMTFNRFITVNSFHETGNRVFIFSAGDKAFITRFKLTGDLQWIQECQHLLLIAEKISNGKQQTTVLDTRHLKSLVKQFEDITLTNVYSLQRNLVGYHSIDDCQYKFFALSSSELIKGSIVWREGETIDAPYHNCIFVKDKNNLICIVEVDHQFYQVMKIVIRDERPTFKCIGNQVKMNFRPKVINYCDGRLTVVHLDGFSEEILSYGVRDGSVKTIYKHFYAVRSLCATTKLLRLSATRFSLLRNLDYENPNYKICNETTLVTFDYNPENL